MLTALIKRSIKLTSAHQSCYKISKACRTVISKHSAFARVCVQQTAEILRQRRTMDSFWINPKKNKRSKRSGQPMEVATPLCACLSWYYNMFYRMVKAELEEEKKIVYSRIRTWSLGRLQDEGYVLLDCQAKINGNLFGDVIIRFYTSTRSLPLTKFLNGDIITISKDDPMDPQNPEGIVYEKSNNFISAVFKKPPADLYQTLWRLDKGTNIIAFERKVAALRAFCSHYHQMPPWLPSLIIPTAIAHLNDSEKNQVPSVSAMLNDLMNAAGYDRSIVMLQSLYDMGCKMSQSRNCFAIKKTISQLFREDNSFNFNVKGKGPLILNGSQKKAVELCLKNNFLIIQGPPGTGKTFTAGIMIKAWKIMNPNGGPVLATAQSNVAVDQLLTVCYSIGLRAVRIGAPVRVSSDLIHCTLDAQTMKHPRINEVNDIKKEIQNIRDGMKNYRGSQIGLAHRDISILQRTLDELMDKIAQDVVSQSDVICATCVGTGCDLLKNIKFNLVVLDESSQCTEPEALIPLSKCSTNAQVVMIGDHQQLPSVVLCQDESSQRILSFSLFERLLYTSQSYQKSKKNLVHPNDYSSALSRIDHNFEESITRYCSLLETMINSINTLLLDVQYRMHPLISVWPSWKFYNDKLQNGVDERMRIPPQGINWPPVFLNKNEENGPVVGRKPILFINCSTGLELMDSSNSKKNLIEIEVVCQLLKNLYEKGGQQDLKYEDIGIITPYLAQMREITNKLHLLDIPISFSSAEAPSHQPGIEIKTIDGFQGREKELIILSTVRSNDHGELGFLDDSRRVNVALTRARRGLIIIGHGPTLCQSELWGAWIYFAHCENLVRDAAEYLPH